MEIEPLLSHSDNKSTQDLVCFALSLLVVSFLVWSKTGLRESLHSSENVVGVTGSTSQDSGAASSSASAVQTDKQSNYGELSDIMAPDISQGRPLDAETASFAYNWQPVISTYIETWSMVIWENGRPYKRGPLDPSTDKAKCSGKPSCEEFCNKKLQTPFCIKDGSKCWDTSKVGCWQCGYGDLGGSPVWDGSKEWNMVLHSRDSKDYNNHAFMILARQEQKEVAYVFGPGGGAGKQIDALCSRMDEKRLSLYISRIPSDFTVYIFGHSEGSGWAMCMDELMRTNMQPNQRVLLTSGPRMIPQEMLRNLKASPRPFLFLQSGYTNELYDLFTFNGLIPKGYSSPPITAFTCSKNKKHNLDNCEVPGKNNFEGLLREQVLFGKMRSS